MKLDQLQTLSPFFVRGKKSIDLNISIDTRTIKPGEIFWALHGDNTDGHNFLSDAIEKGASALVVNQGNEHLVDNSEITLINVPDTYKALIDVAREVRQNFNSPIAAITGSVGKTTTKAMIKSILSVSKNAFVSHGNQNSDIGLSLNLAKLSNDYECAVFELGINDVGEMDLLADICRPDVAAITWITEAHTEGLGGVDGIWREKSKIFKNFSKDSIAIVSGDQPYRPLGDYKVMTFGQGDKNNFRVSDIKVDLGISFILNIDGESTDISLQVENPVFVNNALAAAAMTYYLGANLSDISQGLKNFVPVDGRFKRKKMANGFGDVIDDSYNGAPESIKESIKAFDKISHDGLKVAIIGDMGELGEFTRQGHLEVGELINKMDIDKVIFVGKNFSSIGLNNENFVYANHWKDAKVFLDGMMSSKMLVLCKGSNAMGLKNIVAALV